MCKSVHYTTIIHLSALLCVVVVFVIFVYIYSTIQQISATLCVFRCMDVCAHVISFVFHLFWSICWVLLSLSLLVLLLLRLLFFFELYLFRSCVYDTNCIIKMHAAHIVRTVISLIWLPARAHSLSVSHSYDNNSRKKWIHSWIIYSLNDYMREREHDRIYACFVNTFTYFSSLSRNI